MTCQCERREGLEPAGERPVVDLSCGHDEQAWTVRSPTSGPPGDLFDLAGAIADLVDAPVTIEDSDTAVLAYSDGQVSVDDARTNTILGRRVPQRYRDALESAGVYRRVHREHGVVYADLGDAGMKPRAIIGVHGHGELLGSIWVALDGQPTPEQEKVLVDAAQVVRELIVRQRTARDAGRRDRSDAMAAVLAGGADAVRAAVRLGLGPAGPVTVATIRPVGAPGSELDPDRIADALSLHLSSIDARAVSALVDDVAYVVIAGTAEAARRVLSGFVQRGVERAAVVVGLGRPAADVAEAHRSRSEADEVAAALVTRGTAGVVGTIDDAFLDVVTLRVGDVLGAQGWSDTGPLPLLARHDAEHATDLVKTARVYLAHGGDVRRAADDLHVHPNTLRNRVRRAAQVCGVDLDDADTRLAVMLQLRLEDLRPSH